MLNGCLRTPSGTNTFKSCSHGCEILFETQVAFSIRSSHQHAQKDNCNEIEDSQSKVWARVQV
jgi:hypothetical protein